MMTASCTVRISRTRNAMLARRGVRVLAGSGRTVGVSGSPSNANDQETKRHNPEVANVPLTGGLSAVDRRLALML